MHKCTSAIEMHNNGTQNQFCFGWVNQKTRKFQDESYLYLVTPVIHVYIPSISLLSIEQSHIRLPPSLPQCSVTWSQPVCWEQVSQSPRPPPLPGWTSGNSVPVQQAANMASDSVNNRMKPGVQAQYFTNQISNLCVFVTYVCLILFKLGH